MPDSFLSIILWLSLYLSMMAVVWPKESVCGRSFLAQAHLAFALVSLCIFAGTALVLLTGTESRILLAFVPVAFAGALRIFFGKLFYLATDPISATPLFDKYILFLLPVIVCLLALWGVLIPHFHYDSLLYHLPTAALAWQQHSLSVITAHPQIGSNPILAELPKVWAFAFSGDDSLASLQQLPYLAGLVLLTIAFARSLKVNRWYSAAAGLALILVPKVFEQALSGNIDLIAGFWGASCVKFLSRKMLLPAAVSLLVFAVVKYTTLLPATIGALALFVLLWKTQKGKAVLWLLVFGALGGLWEWRNIAVYGNPTFPYQILSESPAVATASRFAPGWVVTEKSRDGKKWDGYYLNRIESAADPESRHGTVAKYWRAWGDQAFVPYDKYSGRWGPFWFVLALPALACFLLLQLKRRRLRPDTAALCLALLFYFATVKSWETRFGILLLPFGMAAACWALSLASRTRLLKWIAAPACVLALLGCALQIAKSHPNPLLFASSQMPDGLSLTTLDPEISDVRELSLSLAELKPKSLWIDFTRGQEHHYGMAGTLLYPYFSKRWDREVRISTSVNAAEEIRAMRPDMLLLQTGSALGEAAVRDLGYRPVLKNRTGAIYARL